MKRLLLALAPGLSLWLAGDAARADHNLYLPLVPNTPLMQSIKATQEVLWCVNDRAAAYPNFVDQVRDVNDQYTQRTSIKHRQVAWGTPASTGCQEQHNMAWGLQCGGCAAHVFYANWAVVIEYKEDLLFTDWRTAIGHEIGHARLGLGERYRDSGGTIGCDSGLQGMINRLGYASVMSCGTGVMYPQPFDVTNGCAALATSWCGQAPAQTFPFWDGTFWVFADGAKFKPNAGCGEWYLPDGRLEWGACDPSWGARWQDILKCWISPTTAFCNGQHGRIYPIP